MIRLFIKHLNKKFLTLGIIGLLLSSGLYSYVFIDDNNNLKYLLHNDSFSLDDLIINEDIICFKKEGSDKWFLSNGNRILRELEYSTIISENAVLIAVKNGKYTILSLSGEVLADNLIWADSTQYGIAIKESTEKKIRIINDHNNFIITGYDYAIPCSSDYYICWNVNGITPTWYLLNSVYEILETSNKRIIEFNGHFFVKDENGVLFFDNTGMRTINEMYSDCFHGGQYFYVFNKLIRKWEILDDRLQKAMVLNADKIPATISYNNKMIIKDIKNDKLELLDISNNTNITIDDYLIGDKYLFAKYGKKWIRIY